MELLTGWGGLSEQGASAECGVGGARQTDQRPVPRGPAPSVEFSRAWVNAVSLLDKCTVAQWYYQTPSWPPRHAALGRDGDVKLKSGLSLLCSCSFCVFLPPHVLALQSLLPVGVIAAN